MGLATPYALFKVCERAYLEQERKPHPKSLFTQVDQGLKQFPPDLLVYLIRVHGWDIRHYEMFETQDRQGRVLKNPDVRLPSRAARGEPSTKRSAVARSKVDRALPRRESLRQSRPQRRKP
jgi:hypothetical protein